ncbi:vesicle transport protein SFT2B [Solanum tuberosum]|uniref:vesicle transport protein SFT2B n=1 Tax=Solanum tuberosum TaxID=4113 RepID=UPI0003D25BB9|nr:PREDICTED: vesicle transport protein SFT2B [Solanum tuberosum]
MWRLSESILGENEEQQDNLFGDQEALCSVSPLQRVYGFAACLLAGFICMFLSMIVFIKPIKFALLFTFGNMLAIGSTTFLIGPMQQLSMMMDPVRAYATYMYVGCVVLALICALWIHSKILTLLAIICEICALVWYSLSYIPFASRMVSNVAIRLFDTEI